MLSTLMSGTQTGTSDNMEDSNVYFGFQNGTILHVKSAVRSG